MGAVVGWVAAAVVAWPASSRAADETWADSLQRYESTLSVAGRVYERQRLMLDAFRAATPDPSVAAALADAKRQLDAEAKVLEEGRSLLVRSRRSVEGASAGGSPDGSAKTIAAARRDLDAALAAGTPIFAHTEVFARLDRAATAARIHAIVRATGGRWLVRDIYFAPGGDRIRPAESRAATDDLMAVLRAGPRVAIAIAALPLSDADDTPAGRMATERAFEVKSYLVQTGAPAARVRRSRAPARLGPGLREPEPLIPHPRPWTPSPAGLEDGRIVMTIVRRCR